MVNEYSNSTIRDSAGLIIGYAPVSETTPYNPQGYQGSRSDAYNAIVAQYSFQQGNVVGSSPTYQQGSFQAYDPSGNIGISGRAGQQAEAWQPLQQSIYANQNPTQPFQSTVPIRDISSNAPTRIENMRYNQYDLQTLEQAPNRAGYSSNIGDTTTQAAIRAGEIARGFGFNVASADALTGRALSKQMEMAYATPGLTDDRFYSGEYQKWAQNKVELSSTYHHIGMTAGVPIPANRWEYQGDLAVELLKGQPRKDSERFSPVSGEMAPYLPQYKGRGEGVQDYAWRLSEYGAKGAGPVSYGAATEKLISAEGQYGPYGKLYGGPEFKATVEPQKSYSEQYLLTLPTPFSSVGKSAVIESTPTSEYQVAPVRTGFPNIMGMFFSPFAESGSQTMKNVTSGGMGVVTPTRFNAGEQYRAATGPSANLEYQKMTPNASVGGPLDFVNNLFPRATASNEGTLMKPSYASPMDVESGINYGMIPKPFVGVGKSGVVAEAEPTSYFDEVSNVFKSGQNISGIYNLGASVPTQLTQDIKSFVSTAPILSSIYAGGGVFELKSDYERTSISTEKAISPLLKSYETELTTYNQNLEGYNTRLSQYNLNKTQDGYNALTFESSNLESQKKRLDIQQSNIDAALLPMKTAESKYNIAAGNLVGNVNQKQLYTYGAGTFIGDIGKGYTSTIETPVKSVTSGWGGVGQFISGVVSAPSQITTIGESALIGGETIIRNAPSFPGIAAVGTAMQMKGTYEMGTTNPAGLLGTIAGIALVTGGVRAIGGQAIGYARTSNMNYVPVETIGYDVNRGFAIGEPTSAGLRTSFERGTLSPYPTRMSLGEELPYVPGVGGRPFARLPNAGPDDIVLFTGHESSALTRGVRTGEAIHLTTPGTSEVSGVYGASVLMSYFTKAGGQIPKMIGFDMPFKTPTVYSTVVSDVEAVPRSLSRVAMGGDYGPLNRYIQGEATMRPGGQAFLPLAKAEYEAVIPTGSIIEITGRQYYTKLGGFGESHFLGTRTPIVEQRVIGFEPTDVISGIKNVASDISYLDRKPLISLSNVYSGVSISNPAASMRIPSEYRYSEMSKIPAITRGAYSYGETGVLERGVSSRKYPSSPSYSRLSTPMTTEATESRVSTPRGYYGFSSVSKPYSSISSPLSYKDGEKYSLPVPTVITPTYTTPITPTTPGYYGSGKPTPPITPITPLPFPPILPNLGNNFPGSGSPRRFKKFTEYMSFGGLGWLGSGKMSVGTNARRINKLKARKKK